jgi:NAD dependent epimerase/dehydratase family enzyme
VHVCGRAFGAAVRRPAIVPLPEFAGSLLLGEVSDELLMGGQKVRNFKLKLLQLES